MSNGWPGRFVVLTLLAAALPLSGRDAPASNEVVAVKFVKCIDGDTFTCEIPEGYPETVMRIVNVRIRGIDAPELHDKRPEVRQRALDAKDHLEKLLSGAKRIELRRLGKDKYFRILAEVFADGVDVGKALLEKGLAVPYDGGTKSSALEFLAWRCVA